MDKLKVILKKLKKHHFWIVCSLVTLVAIVMVFMAIGTLNEERSAQSSKISSTQSSVEQLRMAQLHPNKQYHDEQEALNKKASQAIAQAWASRYDRQADLLVWPEELDSRLVQKVEGLRPIESAEIDDTSFHMPRRQERTFYSDFIKEEIPALAEMIGARWNPTGGNRSNTMGMEETEEDTGPPPLVLWDQSNQQELKRDHFDWSATDAEGVPTTLQLLYAQEDLWVLEALMEIIKETNGNEIAAHKANIRQIHEISFGRGAGKPTGEILVLQSGDSGSGGPGGPPGGPPGSGDGGVPGEGAPPFGAEGGVPGQGGFGGSGDSGGPSSNSPAELRYVDKDYEPLTAAGLQAAVDSEDPGDAYLAVAKRMPVRMRFTMDQRRIPRLLLACANSDLTVEVRQVHVDMQTYDGDPAAQAGGGGGGGPSPFGGGLPGLGQFPGGGGAAPSGEGGSSQRPYDAEVEIYGIIYIYNPVNPEKLDVDSEVLEEFDFGVEGGGADAAP